MDLPGENGEIDVVKGKCATEGLDQASGLEQGLTFNHVALLRSAVDEADRNAVRFRAYPIPHNLE